MLLEQQLKLDANAILYKTLILVRRSSTDYLILLMYVFS